MTTVGTGDGSVAIGILTGLGMTDLGDIIATEHLTGMMTGDIAIEDLNGMMTADIETEDLAGMMIGDIAIETQTAIGPGVGAAVSRDFSKMVRTGDPVPADSATLNEGQQGQGNPSLPEN